MRFKWAPKDRTWYVFDIFSTCLVQEKIQTGVMNCLIDAISRKCAGNIADGLRCSPWRKVESPGKQQHLLCGGDTHGNGCTSIVHPSKVALHQPSKLAESHSRHWGKCSLITCGTVVCCCISSLSSCVRRIAMIDVLFNYADGRYQRNLSMYLGEHLEGKQNLHVLFFSWLIWVQ